LKEKLTNVQADELDRFASLVDTIIWLKPWEWHNE
jgi:hypothetical protein